MLSEILSGSILLYIFLTVFMHTIVLAKLCYAAPAQYIR